MKTFACLENKSFAATWIDGVTNTFKRGQQCWAACHRHCHCHSHVNNTLHHRNTYFSNTLYTFCFFVFGFYTDSWRTDNVAQNVQQYRSSFPLHARMRARVQANAHILDEVTWNNLLIDRKFELRTVTTANRRSLLRQLCSLNFEVNQHHEYYQFNRYSVQIKPPPLKNEKNVDICNFYLWYIICVKKSVLYFEVNLYL